MKQAIIGATRAAIAVSLMIVMPVVLASTSESTGKNDFQQVLKSRGWQVQQAPNGTLTIAPPKNITANQKGQKKRSAENISLPMEALRQHLESSGWKVRMNSDGSLGFYMPEQSLQSESKERESTAYSTQELEAIEKHLESLGWAVSRETDGTLNFHMQNSASQESPKRGGEKEQATQSQSAEVAKGLDKLLLKNPYWRAERAIDGSLLLYPDKVKSDDISKTAEQSTQANICMGVSVMGAFELPIDEWSEANSIARAWIESIEEKGLTVGKIRKILRVYLISIVRDTKPYALQHQIAIRQLDGRVVVLN